MSRPKLYAGAMSPARMVAALIADPTAPRRLRGFTLAWGNYSVTVTLGAVSA